MITIEKAADNLVKVKVPKHLVSGDFKAIEPTVDRLIQEHGKIRLLLDAREFDGWQNVDAAKEHFRFVKTHQHNIERAALIAGHQWQHWVGAIAETFLEPAVHVFDDPDAALAWVKQ